MALTDPINRSYNLDDLEMLQKAQVFHDNYVEDEALFQAAFTKFGLTYAADFQTKIDDADAIPSGDEVEADIIYLTNQIEEKMVVARTAMQKLFTYVEVAFNDSGMMQKFGRHLYERARGSHMKMKELLERGHRKASDASYQADLLAAGYTAADITQLATLRDEIAALNVEQEDLKDDRGDKTQERITAYNAVWAYMEELNQASKVVFADNPAKLTQYLLYPTVHHAPAKVTGLAYSLSGGLLTWNGVSGVNITYEVQFAPDLPEPIFSVVYEGSERELVYNPGGPDNYLFRIRAIENGISGEWSDVLTVVRT